MKPWKELFEQFFGRVGDPSPTPLAQNLLGPGSNHSAAMLDAEGCRELWVQGEAFRHYRTKGLNFHTNAVPIFGNNSKADFACLKPDASIFDSDGNYSAQLAQNLLMLAELKVLGYDYQNQVVCGPFYRAPELQDGLRVFRRHPNEQHPPTTWNEDDSKRHGHSLEGAYRRLVRFNAPYAEKWLLLILDRRTQGKEALRERLDATDFELSPTGERVPFLENENLRIVGWRL